MNVYTYSTSSGEMADIHSGFLLLLLLRRSLIVLLFCPPQSVGSWGKRGVLTTHSLPPCVYRSQSTLLTPFYYSTLLNSTYVSTFTNIVWGRYVSSIRE